MINNIWISIYTTVSHTFCMKQRLNYATNKTIFLMLQTCSRVTEFRFLMRNTLILSIEETYFAQKWTY